MYKIVRSLQRKDDTNAIAYEESTAAGRKEYRKFCRVVEHDLSSRDIIYHENNTRTLLRHTTVTIGLFFRFQRGSFLKVNHAPNCQGSLGFPG